MKKTIKRQYLQLKYFLTGFCSVCLISALDAYASPVLAQSTCVGSCINQTRTAQSSTAGLGASLLAMIGTMLLVSLTSEILNVIRSLKDKVSKIVEVPALGEHLRGSLRKDRQEKVQRSVTGIESVRQLLRESGKLYRQQSETVFESAVKLLGLIKAAFIKHIEKKKDKPDSIFDHAFMKILPEEFQAEITELYNRAREEGKPKPIMHIILSHLTPLYTMGLVWGHIKNTIKTRPSDQKSEQTKDS